MGRIKYIMKPEERMVIGIYDGFQGDFWRDLSYKLDYMSYRIMKEVVFCDQSLFGIRDTIKAIARCSDDDEWNEEIGKKIVESKINFKRHLKLAKVERRVVAMTNKACGKMIDCLEDHLDKARVIQDDIEEYYCKGRVE